MELSLHWLCLALAIAVVNADGSAHRANTINVEGKGLKRNPMSVTLSFSIGVWTGFVMESYIHIDHTICRTRRCRSPVGGRHECMFPWAASITTIVVFKERSRGKCQESVSYGPLEPNGIWVDHGCDAKFYICFVTSAKGLECEKGCGKNAECMDEKCRCKKGYFGNPLTECRDLCTCTVYGDPHYKGYDHQYYTFNGMCKYTLTRFKYHGDVCEFNVEVKNERRGDKGKVSYTRLVDVEMYGFKIRLHKEKRIFVNGVRKYLPVKLASNKVTIYNTGEYARLVTGCGLTVSWNGKSEVVVSVPRKYGQHLTGLCGNCNGKQDDYVTRDGRNVSGLWHRDVLYGRSWEVPDDTDLKMDQCVTEEVKDPCTGDMDSQIRQPVYCGLLYHKHQALSPFSKCMAVIPGIAKTMYKSCRYDVCSYFHDAHRVENVVCHALEGFAAECEERGLTIKWRSEYFCPLPCPKNMEYSSSVSGCPATCLDIYPDPNKCHQPPTEGCECVPGYILSDKKCVKKEKCGCSTEMGYMPVGKALLTLDCRHLLRCDMVNGTKHLTKTAIQLRCHENAGCGLRKGFPSCACNDGFFGDGVSQCDPLCNGRKCAEYAHCQDQRCVCNEGYHGNSYIKCEPMDICGGEKCAENAVCINYNCVCKKGFLGDGYKICESLCNERKCVEYAYCNKNKVCVCEKGFHGDGYLKCEADEYCNGKKCASQAECRNFQCQCKNGFFGDPYVYCDMLCSGQRCVAHAYCLSGVCTCREGFHGNGYFKCERIGVCDSRICTKNARCHGYKCVCKRGFYGDGYNQCIPLCYGKRCAEKAVCKKQKCKCDSGFHGNGYLKCEEIDECDGKRCARNAVCFNYQCHCKKGFHGDGYLECLPLCKGRKCVEDAYCFKNRCYCKKGYHGNGYIKCEPKRLCGGKQCTVNANCINFQCVCRNGFIGDGYKKCEELCNNRKCARYAYCLKGKCTCLDGFQGNPYLRCEKQDFCGGRRCALHARCINYKCTCLRDYYGDGYKICKSLCNGVKCVRNAECNNGKCVCKPGFHGDPNVLCEPETHCGGKKCTRHAICINYQCRCKPGYTGNGLENCNKLCAGHLCVENAECDNDEVCVCKKGFHGNGAVKCEPLGECGGKHCVKNAHCYNYQCTCDQGFTGNGYKKCESYCEERKCAKYAYCEANECVCQNGFHGNPYVQCEPRQMCDGKMCASYAVCENYSCKCMRGYIGNGEKLCTPLCDGMTCAEYAVCNSENKCVCSTGYHGDGRIKCEALSQCGGRVCDEYADCVNYVCKCRTGYYGDGYKCTCKKILYPYCDGKKCVENATCIDGKCVCDKGYHGDGSVKCESQGSCGGKTCADHSMCLNYQCVCNENYYGDGCSICLPYCNGRKCVENAECKNQTCICKTGFHGDPYLKCEPYGVCDGGACVENAECINYRCVCKKGYLGDGNLKCQALCRGQKCVAFSSCVNGTCECERGYRGNGLVLCEKSTRCGGLECAENAICKNYQCICRSGYHGDGFDKCYALCKNQKCVENAECINDECVCQKGFHGDGRILCEALGVCGGLKCADNAICLNYQCACMKGYIGNGLTACYELCGGHECVQNAFCCNGTCRCKQGYHGSGILFCENDDFCGRRKCAPNAQCINFHCICREGYRGDGYKECKELCRGRKCAEHADCKDGACMCQDGYHGDAYIKCERNGVCGDKTCADNAECRNYQCHCKIGYHGDGGIKCEALCNNRICVDNSECKNDECVCKRGFHGNGYYKCEPNGICDGRKCHKNAHCVNFMCMCKKGYYGNGITRCNPFCGHRLCVEHSHCVNNQCACQDGYHGNPYLKCEPLHFCGGRTCVQNAVCQNYKCVCRRGYYGDGVTFCEADGYCKGRKCADDAECVTSKCVCKVGFIGDGNKHCKKACYCSLSENSHVRTFDGAVVDIHDSCTHALVKSTKFPDDCSFHVEIKKKGKIESASNLQTMIIIITIYGTKITLGKGSDIYVDGFKRYVPNKIRDGNIVIYKSGEWNVLSTACGFTIWWNGRSSATVQAPVSYMKQLSGICGNCNGLDKDDYVTRDGRDVSTYPPEDRSTAVVDSYLVISEKSLSCKHKKVEVPTCNHESLCKKDSVCGYLNPSSVTSPFQNCLSMYPNLAFQLFNACVKDTCRFYSDKITSHRIACNYMEEFSMGCEQRGFSGIKFRKKDFCPLRCPTNMVYSAKISGCPPTCLDPDPNNCTLPYSEGCECLPGYLWSGTECVLPHQCGCFCPVNFYVPIGKTYVTEDCSEVVECVSMHGRPYLKHIKVNLQCHNEALCGLKDGVPTCICKRGFVGDGYKYCEKVG